MFQNTHFKAAFAVYPGSAQAAGATAKAPISVKLTARYCDPGDAQALCKEVQGHQLGATTTTSTTSTTTTTTVKGSPLLHPNAMGQEVDSRSKQTWLWNGIVVVEVVVGMIGVVVVVVVAVVSVVGVVVLDVWWLVVVG